MIRSSISRTGLERPAVRRVGPVTHAFPVPVALDPLVSSWSADSVLAAQRADTLFSHRPHVPQILFFVSSTVFLSQGIQAHPFSMYCSAVIVLETVNHLPEQTVNNHTSLYSPHRPDGPTIERLVFRTYPPFPFGRVRADVGIGPYAVEEAIPSILPRLNSSGVPSTPAACGRHPLQAGEGRGFPHPALPPSPRRGSTPPENFCTPPRASGFFHRPAGRRYRTGSPWR